MLARLIPVIILLLLRFYDLGARPPHHDEAVNGWFVDGILKRGYYVYDPENYHGPLFFYIQTFFERIFGRSIEVLRFTTTIFGCAVSLTPLLFKEFLGKAGTWIALLFFTISPALVFYSRYSIHETMFVLSCIVFFFYWLKIRKGEMESANFIGLGLTLGAMISLKETFTLYGASIGLAEGLIWAIERKSPVQWSKKFWMGIGVSTLIATAIVILCFTGFFQDANGIPNFFKAFDMWSHTGEKGNGHQKPFEYWIKVMFDLEWYALLGLGFCMLAFKKVPREIRLISFSSFILWLMYSIVPYKTPWCIMSFYWGLMLVAAYWFGQWCNSKNYKAVIIPLLVGGLTFSAYEAIDVSYVHTDVDDHYYIYGQTFHDLMDPVNEINARLQANPSLKNTLHVQVISSFTWPLPYVIGEVVQAGYFSDQNAPPTLDADYVIMDKTFENTMITRMKVANYARVEVRSRQWASPLVFYKKVN